MRPPIYLALALASTGPQLSIAADPASTVTVIWSEGVESPGVCVGKESWFVSVIPADVPLETIETATLHRANDSVEGRILHLDPAQRLCLLEAAPGLGMSRPVTLSTATQLKAGEHAECISGSSACQTTVAGKDWSYRGERFPLPLLRLRVSEEGPHCKAGTPLVSENGELMAILTGQKLEASGEVYAIPSSRVLKLIEDVKLHKRSGPVWIGLIFHNESSTPEIIEVKDASPALKAGLKPGDVILAMNSVEIESLDDLVEAIHDLPAGTEVKVRVLRGLNETQLDLVPQFAEMMAASQ